MKSKDDRLIKSIICIVDIIMICISGLIAVGMRFSLDTNTFHVKWYGIGFLSILVSTIIIMYFNKLYDLRYKSWFVQVPKIINSFVYAMLIFTLFSFYVREVSYSRLALGYFSIAAVVLLLAGRYFTIYCTKLLYKKGIGAKRLLCIGMNERSLSVLNYLNEHREFGYIIVGYLDYDNSPIENDYPYIDKIQNYKEILSAKEIDSILLASDNELYLKEIIEYCEDKYIQAYMIPGLLNMTTNPVSIGQISTIPLIRFKEGALSSLQVKIKRIFDVYFSVLGLLGISPIFLLIMLTIKLTTKSSIFFVQERYGVNGEIIRILKFRTMVENAEEVLDELMKNNPKMRKEYNKYRKLTNDPRITPIGRILRKTSLDELPQLINIIRGDLSIVGPRPMMKDEMEKYGKDGKIVLKVYPGLTGLWQVSGRNRLPFSERVRLDIYYINNWSFWLDIIIILKTIPVVLKREGAQ